MRASVLYDIGKMEIRDLPEPTAGPRDVKVKVDAVGLCGTDFHIFSGEANYNFDERDLPIPLAVEPQVMGHEITGTVVDAGAEVGDLEPGQRVVLDQGLNCHSTGRTPHCEYCATGDSHQCEDYREYGITGLVGGLAEYLALPAINAIRLESDLAPAEAAMTEPLGCVLHSTEMALGTRTRYAVGADDPARRVKTALITGAGPAGLLFVQVLRNVRGFDGQLLVSEPDPKKRELAASFGADVIDPTSEDLVEVVNERTGGRRCELFIEASGYGPVFLDVPRLIRKQATFLLYGFGHGGVGMEALNSVHFLEPFLVAPCGASGGFDEDGRPTIYRHALKLIEDGTVKVAPLMTHLYQGLDSVPGAFGSDHAQPGYVKGMAVFGS